MLVQRWGQLHIFRSLRPSLFCNKLLVVSQRLYRNVLSASGLIMLHHLNHALSTNSPVSAVLYSLLIISRSVFCPDKSSSWLFHCPVDRSNSTNFLSAVFKVRADAIRFAKTTKTANGMKKTHKVSFICSKYLSSTWVRFSLQKSSERDILLDSPNMSLLVRAAQRSSPSYTCLYFKYCVWAHLCFCCCKDTPCCVSSVPTLWFWVFCLFTFSVQAPRG